MDEKEENIHAGHRSRMIDKFLDYPKALTDHEILEILLYFTIPRKDTNEIAHKIIKKYGDLDGLFRLDHQALISTEGISERTADLIMVIEEILYRTTRERENAKEFYSFLDYKNEVLDYYASGLRYEEAVFFLFDKHCRKQAIVPFSSFEETSVSFDTKEVVGMLANYRPTYLVFAHNHPHGFSEPSKADDYTTSKLNLLCFMHGIKMLDHLIVFGNDVYSYYREGRLIENFTEKELKKLFDTVKEITDEQS